MKELREEVLEPCILETCVVHDKENDCNVWCVRFRDKALSSGEVWPKSGSPALAPDLRARQEAFRLCPHPWGTEDDPQALPSSYLGEAGGTAATRTAEGSQ